jgi:predicted RNA polymerase sigma factor
VMLPEQDRRRWDHAQIARGRVALQRALALGGGQDRYVLQAAIAECHARARRHEDTDWTRIAVLYGVLARVHPSPVVELNHVVAVARAESPSAAWSLLQPLLGDARLRGYAPLWAVRGDLLQQLGRPDQARAAFLDAAALSANLREREALLARAGALGA